MVETDRNSECTEETNKLFFGSLTSRILLTLVIVGFISNIALAQSETAELESALRSIGKFVSVLVVGIAIPNGALGFLQYMTSGSNVEQNDKGKKRIRNTGIAVAGVALLTIAVDALIAVLPNDPRSGTPGNSTGSIEVISGDTSADFTGTLAQVGTDGLVTATETLIAVGNPLV